MPKRLAVLVVLSVGGLWLAVCLLVLPAGAAPAAGTTYYVDPAGNDGHSCTAPGAATACRTIGGALSKAAAAGDTLVVAAGTYHEHLTIGKSVTINGAGAATTLVDGSSTDRVVTITVGVNVVLAGLTIQHGHTANNGGGLRNSGALALKNMVVVTNTAVVDGGGLYNSGVLSLTNSTVLSNTALNGGGLASIGPAFGSAAATLDNSLIQGNVVISAGAGVFSSNCLCSFTGPATLTLLNHTIIRDNIASFSGGAGIYSNGTLNATSSQINNNWSQIVVPAGYTGGGLLIAGGTAVLTNDTLNANRSSSYGGAIAVGSGALTVTNPAMANNTAYWGGDIATSPTATATFIGGSLVGGSVSVDGGSIHNMGSLNITGTLLNQSHAPFGRAGAIDNLGSLVLTNSSIKASSALAEAGGLLNEPGGTLLMSGDSFAFNLAGTDGGGLDNRGQVGMSNVQFSSNQASGRGGGLYNEPGAVVLSLTGGFGFNQAGSDGGGLFNAGAFNASNLNLQNNLAPFGSGGGIFNVTGTLTLTDSDVEFNAAGAQTAPNGGGGIYNTASAGLWMTGGRLYANSAGSQGGGLFNTSSSATLTSLTVTSNTVSGGYDEGGGIFNGGRLQLQDVTLTSNLAGYDGAGLSNAGYLTVTDSLISGNQLEGSYFGGGAYNTGSLTMIASTVSGNRGTAVFNLYGQTVVVASTISGNQGSGLSNQGVAATLVMTNTTVSGNSTTGNGGGLYNDRSATLNNVTVAGNTADSLHLGTFYGGGVYMPLTFTARLTVANTILAGNLIAGVSDGYSADCISNGQITSLGYNLVGTNDGCGFSASLTDKVGTPGHLINPLLAPLALNNNPHGPYTRGLFQFSPARDAGSPFVFPNPSACANVDERGVARPGQHCDIGAYQGFVPLLQLFLPLVRH